MFGHRKYFALSKRFQKFRLFEKGVKHSTMVAGVALVRDCSAIINGGGGICLASSGLSMIAHDYFAPNEIRTIIEISFLHGHEDRCCEEILMGLLDSVGISEAILSQRRHDDSRLGYSNAPPEWFCVIPSGCFLAGSRQTEQ